MKLEEQIRIISKIKKELRKRSASLLSLMISGSDLYGFRSEDSDVDLRGTFIYETSKFLGFNKPKLTLELKIDDYDIVVHEIGRALSLAMDGNSNLLENIFSDQIYTVLDYLDLKNEIVLNKRGILNSYKGLALHNYKKFIMTGRKKTIKKYLYVFRGLLAGIYALETGKIEPNILILNKHFKNPYVKTLVKLKKEGKEKEDLPKHILDSGEIERVIEKLFKRIDSIYLKTIIGIPNVSDWEALEKKLIKVRKSYFDT